MGLSDGPKDVLDIEAALAVEHRELHGRPATFLSRLLTAPLPTAEKAEGQWTPYEESDAFTQKARCDVAFQVAANQGVIGLHRRNAVKAKPLRNSK